MLQLNGYKETDHYIFHYIPGSSAERDIKKISLTQEQCWQEICSVLGTEPGFKIHYYLVSTEEEVGKAYGDNEPCSGFACAPDKIYAVYNEKLKCIGPHEDAHIISYTINEPPQCFIREGLAMFFDTLWWGRPNEAWVKDFIKEGKYIKIGKLLDNEEFLSHSDAVTYPIAGAFTGFLINKIGISAYLELYRRGSFDSGTLKTALHCEDIDRPFQSWLQSLDLT